MMAGKTGHRDKMRDECVAMQATLMRRRSISMHDLADEIGVSVKTARRWVNSFSLVMPLRVQRGTVIVGEDVL
jgi:predicted DNA-binding transcriptional regulator YafY